MAVVSVLRSAVHPTTASTPPRAPCRFQATFALSPPILFLFAEMGFQADSRIALVEFVAVVLLAAVVCPYLAHAHPARAVVPKEHAWFATAAPSPAEAAHARVLSSQRQHQQQQWTRYHRLLCLSQCHCKHHHCHPCYRLYLAQGANHRQGCWHGEAASPAPLCSKPGCRP